MNHSRKVTDNRKRNICLMLAFIITAGTMLTACSYRPSEGGNLEATESMPETLGLAPVFTYELPVEKPGVQVDQAGYLPESTKTAVFQGKELPEKFRILIKGSDECVYTGEVRQKGRDPVSGLQIGYGNFSDFRQEGDYYIESEKIGCSYYFAIGKDVYQEAARRLKAMLESAQDGAGGWQTDEKGNKDTAEACETLSYLLLACEQYPQLFRQLWASGGAGEAAQGENAAFFETLRTETDWLLSMQDEKTGGVYGGLKAVSKERQETEKEQLPQEIDDAATASFAGAMAKYGYLYQQYDRDYATLCLKAAAKAWKYLETTWYGKGEDKNGADITGRFYAAAELYRASNEARYHNYILQNQERILNEKTDFYLLMGETTYLSTKREVDDALCGRMMDALMKQSESITQKAKENLFLVEEENTEDILQNMTIMSVVDYAITNHEYATVIENHIHYLLGRNRESEILLKNLKLKDAARILLLLSMVTSEKSTASG